jgi:micrococcal nuclease
MCKIIFIFLLAVFGYPAFSHASTSLSITDSIPAKEARKHYNESLKIYGVVSGGRHLEKSFITLINVDGNYPNHALTIMIKDIGRKKFSYAPETFLKGKKIVVSGKVMEYKGKPEVIVSEVGQIVMVE